jgi:hypothetical protein
MTAGGVAVQHLEQEEVAGSHGRPHARTPGGLAGLLAHRHPRVRLELGCPLGFQARQHGPETRDHPAISDTCGGTDHFRQELWKEDQQ